MGAATLAKNIVQPNQAAIESKAGLKLSVLVNGSGNGLMDLVAGKADMAMIAAPIEAEAKIINAKGTRHPGRVYVAGQAGQCGEGAVDCSSGKSRQADCGTGQGCYFRKDH
jgi:hypothetical protein